MLFKNLLPKVQIFKGDLNNFLKWTCREPRKIYNCFLNKIYEKLTEVEIISTTNWYLVEKKNSLASIFGDLNNQKNLMAMKHALF